MLETLLLQRKRDILKGWFQLISEAYPGDGLMLERERDQFNNPIGYNISHEMENLCDELIRGSDTEKLCSSINNVIRITAVQNLSPSQAVSLVFLLKKAVRQHLSNEIGKGYLSEELLEFESRIDELALFAFDAYMDRREKIFDIRVREVRDEKDRAFKLLEKLNGSCR